MKKNLVWDNLTISEYSAYATMLFDESETLSNLLDLVYVHDYSYMMSDDDRVWTRGHENERQIAELIDILITDLRNDKETLKNQLLECRKEQYPDGLTHRIINTWFLRY